MLVVDPVYITIPEEQAAKGNGGDEYGADYVKTHGEPAGGGQE